MADETSVGIFSASNVAAIIKHKNERDEDRPLNVLFQNEGHGANEIEIRVGTRRPSRVQHTSIDGEAAPVSRGDWTIRKYGPSVMKAFDLLSSDDVACFRRADELAKIMDAGGTVSGTDQSIMDRAMRRLREVGEAIQSDLAEEKHALCAGALQGNVAFTFNGLSQSVSYGLNGLAAPSPVWTSASALIPKNIRTLKRLFSESSADGVEPDTIVVPSDIIENAFDGNTEWKDFAKRTPDLALEYLGRTVGGDSNDVKPGPFGMRWIFIKGMTKSVTGSSARRWPINKITLLNAAKSGLSWGMCVGTEYNPRPEVKIEIEPPARVDVKTWKCHGFFNGLPVLASPSNVQTVEVWTV